MNSLMLLVAKILGVKSECADSDVFALMEGAMNVMGIHNLLPQSARRVDIAEVATELLYGDHILIRTAGSKQRFHHGIFVGPISGVQGGKNLVVDCWGSHDACKQEAKIRLRTLGEFMAVPGWPELADPSFNEESNASEEPMTTTVEDYDALLRELENCRIKNQTLIKHNDELKLISETTMHENILLKSQLVPELSPYHFGHDLLTSLNLPFCNTKCCIVLLDSSGARQCKKNRQATGLLCTTHASSPKHVAEKVNKAYATRCFERQAKVISASQTQSDCVTAYTSACDDNNYATPGLDIRTRYVMEKTGVLPSDLGKYSTEGFASDAAVLRRHSAAVKSAYDSAVSASNQTYGIGALDSNGDILLRGNLRISETANIYKGTEVFSSGGGGGIITSDSNIVPSVNGTQDLGAPDKRWRNLYLSGNLISFGNGMNIDGYSWNYLANYVVPQRVLENTVSTYLFTGAAQDHSAYVRNGELYMYGRNDYGQLGLGHTSNIAVPTKVPGITNAALVACGERFTLCVRTDGTAISTGQNTNGQLGIGSTVTTSNFSIVAGVSNAIAVDAGYTHAMYMTSNGIVVSAGSDANGQLGRGASSANVVINANIVPMLMPDGSNVYARAISAGGYHSAVLLNNGSAYLCGKNDQGQCGASPTLVPQANSLGIISTLSNVIDVACGHEHTLFTRYDGQVLGFGRNDRGQLGQGNKTSPVTSVVQVLAGGGAGSSNGLSVEIAAGFNHSAYIKNDNTIFVFGANDKGQLGLGQTTTEALTPTQLVGYAGYDIACGRNHTVISTTPDPLTFNYTGNNALIAFGDNAHGQVGDNNPNVTTRWFPNRIHDGTFKKKLHVGQHRCFVDALAPARLRDHEGLVVVTDKNAYASGLLRGRQRAMTINQALPLVSLSKVPKDPRAFGVISLTQDHPAGPSAAISATEILKIAEQGDVRVQINSLGEGCIWVCDETGSTIHAGDYVTTSSLSGYASLQVLDDGDVPDGTLRNYTVAKLTMDCDFSQPLVDVEEVQKDEYGNVVFDADGSLLYTIVTTTHGPSVVDPDTGETRTGEPLETPIPVTEPSYKMRWMTTEIDASSGVSITTLISKEDYDKRGMIQFGEGGSSTISFSNAPDTGLFNPVARTLGVVAGGTEMVRVSDTTVSLLGDLVVSSNIVPMTNATQYLGTSTMHFKEAWIDELHISSNTLYIGDTPVLCADNDAVSISADPGQGITLTTTGDGETSMVSAKGVNVVSEGGVTMRVSGPLGRVNIQSSGAGGTVNLGAEKEIVMTAPLTTISSNMIVKGDLTVEGTQLTLNTQTVTVEDNIIVLNS
eukprot:gene2606-biopygen12212